MKVLKNTVLVTAMAMSFAVCGPASAQGKDLKVGLLLPFSQVFAVYGEAIKEGFDLAIEEAGDRTIFKDLADCAGQKWCDWQDC